MTFRDFALKYLDPTHPSGIYTIDGIVAATGLTLALVSSYVTFAQQVVFIAVQQGKPVPGVEAIIAAWEDAHPPVFVTHTVFGDVVKPLADLKAVDLTAQQLHDLVVDSCKQALGK